MSIDAIAAVFLIVFLGILLYVKRAKVEVQRALFPLLYVVMYRSDVGVAAMQRLARRFPRLLRFLGNVGIVAGFAGMVFIVLELVAGSFLLFTHPEAAAGIQPVLPIEAKGVFFVPFLYWVVSIFLIAVVHEFAHGVLSFVHKIPVKRSGFAFLCIFLPVIPAAFVEPNEKILRKAKKSHQLAVFAAGPAANGLFAMLALLLFFAISPVLSAAFEQHGLTLDSVEKDSPAFSAGLKEGMTIIGVDNVSVMSNDNLSSYLKGRQENETIILKTDNASFPVLLRLNPKNQSRVYLGVQVKQNIIAKESFVEQYGKVVPQVIKWFAGLFFWLFMLNLGIGLFNLLPMGPLDGGRMSELACERLFGKNGRKVWSGLSLFLVAIIILNLVVGFVR